MSRNKNPKHDHEAGKRKRLATERWRCIGALRGLKVMYLKAMYETREERSELFALLNTPGKNIEFHGREYSVPIIQSDAVPEFLVLPLPWPPPGK